MRAFFGVDNTGNLWFIGHRQDLVYLVLEVSDPGRRLCFRGAVRCRVQQFAQT